MYVIRGKNMWNGKSKINMKKIISTITLLLGFFAAEAQNSKGSVGGTVADADRHAVELAIVTLHNTPFVTATDSLGIFNLKDIPAGEYQLVISATGYITKKQSITVQPGKEVRINASLITNTLNEVVVTGTLREVSRKESPIPVEVYTPKFFQKNPTPSLLESVGQINGVMPQLNCNICNTGDIHINGMEGPYTLILIDGMPIVSGLATVYGLSGIPNSLVERLEVVKGPASSLYGSEAMGGTINIITRNPNYAPAFSVDAFATNWKEYNIDASAGLKIGSKIKGIAGVNYFNYNNRVDKNGDGFTDVTLQNRVSLFNKWNIERKNNYLASLALRYVYEDRWGGQMNWGNQWRGTDSIYGESIYTKRYELIGLYQLPFKERLMLQYSYNYHDQNSYYGTIPYMAKQQIGFAQLYWDKKIQQHNILAGATYRYTWYDDNTPGTAKADFTNKPAEINLPGIFGQEEWGFAMNHKLLLGYRLDYDRHHGLIQSPRVAYKWSPNSSNTLRASFGTGFRVVNLFTEDHAALTGAREVVIKEALNPERSYNSTINYVKQILIKNGFINLDITPFYSYFTNKIVGDFDTDPQKIIYGNINGYAISQGISLNTDIQLSLPLTVRLGVTYMDVYQKEDNGKGELIKKVQLYAPQWSGNFAISTTVLKNYSIDLTGKLNGPMRLPIVPNDYRPEYSPTYCIANIQVTRKFKDAFEIYGGVKNLLNFVPADPILRPFDPFDKRVNDPVNNPNNYTFDPSYNYASMQGIRVFLGARYTIKRK